MTRYSDADFQKVEAKITFWNELLASDAWKELLRDRQIMIYAWEKSLRTEDANSYHRTQGMVRGAEVVLGYPQDKITETTLLLESMRSHNEGMDVEVEDAVD